MMNDTLPISPCEFDRLIYQSPADKTLWPPDTGTTPIGQYLHCGPVNIHAGMGERTIFVTIDANREAERLAMHRINGGL